jgi:hypothetical protein
MNPGAISTSISRSIAPSKVVPTNSIRVPRENRAAAFDRAALSSIAGSTHRTEIRVRIP